MKSMIVVALALVAVAVAVPVEEPAKILRSNFDQSPDGAYNFGFETEDGITRQETGELKEVVDAENKPQEVIVVRGSFSYTNPDGTLEKIEYEAGPEGYKAVGPSVPKSERR